MPKIFKIIGAITEILKHGLRTVTLYKSLPFVKSNRGGSCPGRIGRALAMTPHLAGKLP
jgi:hypothetical protein